MRVVTIASLAASAVLGLGALFVAKTFLPNTASAKGQPAQKAGVSMVVAARDIKYGDKLAAEMLVVIKAPEDMAPQGAFSSVAQVLAADKGGAPVALVPISAREPLMPAKLSGPGARASVAAMIEQGMRAYTLKVTDVSGVGGHALPGDHVDVVLMRDLTPEGDVRTFVSDVVLQNVRVLGVDLNADQTAVKPAEPETATLEVNVEDAQKLAVAANLGQLSLALRRTGQAELAQAASLRTGDFLKGGRPAPAAAGPVLRRVANPGVYRPAAPAGFLVVEGQANKRPSKTPSKADGANVTTTVPAPAVSGSTVAAAAGTVG